MSARVAIIDDTPNNTIGHFDRLKQAGIKTVIRYLALGKSWKTVTPAEAHAIADAGLRLGLVFEVDGKPHGRTVGARDGAAAFTAAQAAGAPDGAIIWYAVDYDPNSFAMSGIIAAFIEFGKEVGPRYRVGAYCSGYCASKLIAAGAVDSTKDLTTGESLPCIWITQSLGFRGSRDYLASGKPFVMFQLLPTHTAGLDVDPNISWHNYLGESIDIGDFVPFAKVPA
jgi:hypothetical protein